MFILVNHSIFATELFCMKKYFWIAALFLFTGLLNAQEAPEGLFIASKAPDFKARDQDGKEVRLKDLLKQGKVVLVFYRGQWCPYCNKHLTRLQDSLELIKAKGATVVAVTLEKPENITKTVEKTKAGFSILYDEGAKISKAYDVEFEVPENTVTRYRNSGIDLVKLNTDEGKYLPIPAVYIIEKESSTVIYRFFEQDYKKRPSVKELLEKL